MRGIVSSRVRVHAQCLHVSVTRRSPGLDVVAAYTVFDRRSTVRRSHSGHTEYEVKARLYAIFVCAPHWSQAHTS